MGQAEPVTEPTVVIEGKGWGHGVGMAQDGALAMGREGASTADILQHFYPGTTLGQDGGAVRVVVSSAPEGATVVSFPSGGEVRSSRSGAQAPGFPVSVAPGGSVRLRFDGSYRAEPLTGATVAALGAADPVVVAAQSTAAPGPVASAAPEDDEGGGLLGGGLLGPDDPPSDPPPSDPPPVDPPKPDDPAAPPDQPGGVAPAPPPPPDDVAVSGSALWAVPRGATVGVPARSATYRGVVQAVAGDGGLRLVNEVDVEDYLRGMGEVLDSSWPRASLGAQAVAARTYALRAMDLGGELCDTQDCQVYLGSQAEYGAMDAAVAATGGQVVQFQGRLAQAVYSASGGGITATPDEGFGNSGQGLPYLGATSYPTADAQAWDLRLPLAQVGRRLSYPGVLSDVRVATTGPSGRALTVELVGDAGPRELPALSFDDILGLRSTLWTVRVETPPAPSETVADAGNPGSRAGGRFAGPSWAVTTPGQGRLLGSGDAVRVAALADLEGPFRTGVVLTTAAWLLAFGTGAVFRLAAGQTARQRRRRATAGPEGPAVASV